MIISKRKVIKNMLSLSLAEIFNKGVLFFTTAYMARVLGTDGFGIIGFANSYISYFILFSSLGLHVIGTREVARYKNESTKYVNAITTLRILLSIFFYGVLLASVLLINKPADVKFTLLIIGFSLIANAILVDWVFQAIEKMEYLAIRQVVTSLITLTGVFLFVKTRSDVWIAVAIPVISTFLNGIWLYAVYRKLFDKFRLFFDLYLYKTLLRSSLPLTFSNFFIIVLHTLNIIILGFFDGDHEAGIFTAAEKIMTFAILPSGILQSAFAPIFAKADTLEDKRKVMNKFSVLTFIIGSIITIGFLTFSDFIVGVTFGSEFGETAVLMKIFMFASLLSYINVSYTPAFIGWNMEKQFLFVIVSSGILNIISNFILIPLYSTTGAAIASVITELAISAGLSIYMYRMLHKIYLMEFIKFLAFAAVSCGIGYLILQQGVHALIAGAISCLFFAGINFIFKTVTLDELKGYIAK